MSRLPSGRSRTSSTSSSVVVAAINSALVNIPRDKVRLHVCWGNYEGPHDHDVPLADTLPILRKAKVGGLFLPFANARHAHEYKLFDKTRRWPTTRCWSPASSTPSPTTSSTRKWWPTALSGSPRRSAIRRRVLAGTDCGFDTSAGMGRVAEDVVWAKLASMVEGARLASQRLFA